MKCFKKFFNCKKLTNKNSNIDQKNNVPATTENNLDEFIYNSLVQIFSGVEKTRKEISKNEYYGAINLVTHQESVDNKPPSQLVEFDFAIKNQISIDANGSLSIVPATININGNYSSEKNNESRIKFSIPITLGTTVLKQ